MSQTLYVPVNTVTGFRALPKDSMTGASLFIIAQEKPWQWMVEQQLIAEYVMTKEEFKEAAEAAELLCQSTWRTIPHLAKVALPAQLSSSVRKECGL